ncbi:unnamed protein product [Lactuca virosa]|uniref:Uncharacterized protein n=1 Tax=Lactuca virosa TaxID=75947 RepID=A0AAU9N886_9ASTR|nr:unnamed protein product [Lactuca virosa]
MILSTTNKKDHTLPKFLKALKSCTTAVCGRRGLDEDSDNICLRSLTFQIKLKNMLHLVSLNSEEPNEQMMPKLSKIYPWISLKFHEILCPWFFNDVNYTLFSDSEMCGIKSTIASW